MSYKILSCLSIVDIPSDIAVCPYCGTKLYATFDAWTQQEGEGNLWTADHIDLECESEPEIDSDEWEDWWASHSDMPYVYMLPVTIKVLEWVKQQYRFTM